MCSSAPESSARSNNNECASRALSRRLHMKHLGGKLWELRLNGRDGIARALYVTSIGRRVVVVRAFRKKTQKTPRAEIEIALRRAKEIT
jgi:phage-related protein